MSSSIFNSRGMSKLECLKAKRRANQSFITKLINDVAPMLKGGTLIELLLVSELLMHN